MKLDFDCAYGQRKLHDKTIILFMINVTGGEFTRYCRFLKGIYELPVISTVIQERIDETLERKHPA